MMESSERVGEALVIDVDGRTVRGEAAARILAERVPPTVEPVDGVAVTDTATWKRAQQYERTAWLDRGRHMRDDRNRVHARRFAGYEVLANRVFGRAIELGCGPFTNMRNILEHASVTQLHLLDPLLNDYLAHSGCQYRNGRLGGLVGGAKPSLRAWLRAPIQEAVDTEARLRRAGVLGVRATLHSCAIEDFVTSDVFDLVVLVNVLEHCRDGRAVLAKVLSLLAPGGTFVFADKLYDPAVVAANIGRIDDAGHPLRIGRGLLEDFLRDNFHVDMVAHYARCTKTIEGEMAPEEIYFIGRRRS